MRQQLEKHLNVLEDTTHHLFYNTVVVSTLLTTIFVVITEHLEPYYVTFSHFLQSYPTVFYWLIVAAIINNGYQVLTHVTSGLKFIGVVNNNFAPGGADENQVVLAFNAHNALDIFGWIKIILIFGEVGIVYSILAFTHVGVGLVSLLCQKTFQNYYIKSPLDQEQCQQLKIMFWFRVMFVWLDAAARIWALSYIIPMVF